HKKTARPLKAEPFYIALLFARIRVWNKSAIGKLCNFVTSLEFADFSRTFFFDFINAHNRMHRNIRTLHACKFIFEPFLGRIDQYSAAIAKNKLLYFNKSIHFALIDRASEDFVDLSLVKENHFINGFNSHITL